MRRFLIAVEDGRWLVETARNYAELFKTSRTIPGLILSGRSFLVFDCLNKELVDFNFSERLSDLLEV